MDQGAADLPSLAPLLAGQPAFVRAAVEAREGWALRTCHAVVGKKPPGWAAMVWEYESAVLIACEMPAEALVSLFTTEGRSAVLASRSVKVPPAHQTVNMQRLPSRALHDAAPLPWPSTDYTVSAKDAVVRQGPQGFLIGDGATPSFTQYQTAIHAFFYDRWSNIGASGVPHELALIRLIDGAAWLDRIRIQPSKIRVRVRGAAYEGARLELNGEGLRRSKTVGKTGVVELSLPRGLPPDAWMYLSRNKRWFDYRGLGAELYRGGQSSGRGDAAGVTVEVAEDADAGLQALLVAGEGPDLEFKSALPQATSEAKRRVFKTVAAFANGGGGTVVFGIDPDELTLTGVVGAAESGTRDRLGNLMRDLVVPTPDFQVRSATFEGKGLVVLSVAAGSGKPYGLKFGDKPVEFYVRRGASTYPATQAEVRAAALSTVPQTEAGLNRWRLR